MAGKSALYPERSQSSTRMLKNLLVFPLNISKTVAEKSMQLTDLPCKYCGTNRDGMDLLQTCLSILGGLHCRSMMEATPLRVCLPGPEGGGLGLGNCGGGGLATGSGEGGGLDAGGGENICGGGLDGGGE